VNAERRASPQLRGLRDERLETCAGCESAAATA
jgi:hypothetical protein